MAQTADVAGEVDVDTEVNSDGTTSCPDLSPCDDGDDCTVGDRCKAGACRPGLDLCVCRQSADCQARHPNRCEGTWSCDTAAPPHACMWDAGSAVVCDASGDNLCSHNVCLPHTGTCALEATDDGIACNDGNNCSFGDACQKGACVAGSDSLCACQQDADCDDDGDPCNGKPYCQKSEFPYKCAINPASVVSCAASAGPCQVVACDAASGSCKPKPAADLTPCDDGDATTLGDACLGGVCKGADLGFCQSWSDCAKFEDGNLCNGTLYCHLGDKTCKLNPATVITCPSANDSACLQTTCQPVTGACVPLPVNGGKACDDGDACTTGDTCQGGGCQAGTDTCLCATDSDCAKSEDGNACNGTLFCDKSKAKPRCELNPATTVLCPTVDDSACSKNACVLLGGACTATAVELTKLACDGQTGVCRREQLPKGQTAAKPSCSDGDPCTVGDGCSGGLCQPGTDTCLCQSDADCADAHDGDLCKGPWYCDKAGSAPVCKPNPAKAVSCPSAADTVCVKALCSPKTGTCKPTLVEAGTPCDDGEPCTDATVCSEGGCKGGAVICACISHADCETKQGDGDHCNGVLYCDKSGAKPQCKLNPASVVECPPNLGTPCLQSVCNPATGFCGAKAANGGKACDDGNICSVADACDGGLCVGAKNPCDDQNACTVDSCISGQGCVHAALPCADGNTCTIEICLPLTGKCVADGVVADGKTCDADGSPCTQGDQCAAGVCKAGPKVACEQPKNACLEAKCYGVTAVEAKCLSTPKADGVSCDDDVSCTVGDACKAGVCVAGQGDSLWMVEVKAGSTEILEALGGIRPGVDAAGGVTFFATRHAAKYTSSVPVMVRLSSTGQVIEQVVLAAKGRVQHSVARPDGSHVLTGNFDTGIGNHMWRVMQPETKAVLAQGAFGSSIDDVAANSGLVVLGASIGGNSPGDPSYSYVTQMNASLAPLWIYKGGANSVTSGVLQHASGEVSVAIHTISGTTVARLTRLSKAGAALWSSSPISAYPVLSTDADDNAWLTGGGACPGLVTALGTSKQVPCPSVISVHRAQPLADGRHLLLGADASLGMARIELRAATGLLEAVAVSPVANSKMWNAVPTADGGWVALGHSGYASVIVAKLSPFLHASCMSAGACYKPIPIACDDADPCTADACDVQKGCKHTPLSGCKP